MLTWTEIETRAIAFQKRWKACTGDERQEAQTLEKVFMNVFGVDWHDGLHEHPIISIDGVINDIDHFPLENHGIFGPGLTVNIDHLINIDIIYII